MKKILFLIILFGVASYFTYAYFYIEESSVTVNVLLILWGIFLLPTLIWITHVRYKKKCKICGSWNAMKKNGENKMHSQESTTKTESRNRTNRRGQVVEEWSVDLPATRYYYRQDLKCKCCGYKRDFVITSKVYTN